SRKWSAFSSAISITSSLRCAFLKARASTAAASRSPVCSISSTRVAASPPPDIWCSLRPMLTPCSVGAFTGRSWPRLSALPGGLDPLQHVGEGSHRLLGDERCRRLDLIAPGEGQDAGNGEVDQGHEHGRGPRRDDDCQGKDDRRGEG